jgi:hypothetical protein
MNFPLDLREVKQGVRQCRPLHPNLHYKPVGKAPECARPRGRSDSRLVWRSMFFPGVLRIRTFLRPGRAHSGTVRRGFELHQNITAESFCWL